MRPWEGIVEIPEGRAGNYAIEHFTKPAGEVPRSNVRTAIYSGQADPPLVFDRETRWHRLVDSDGAWMTDLPIEQVQHDRALREFCGRVLVGGLGLGYAVNVLAARAEVDEVVVVEISPEVVELVGPHVKDPEGKVEIVTDDLMAYVERGRQSRDDMDYFDWAFYDIWRSDGEQTFHEVVVPLRRGSAGWIDNVVCWNEDVMRGQLASGLLTRGTFVQLAAEDAPESHREVVEAWSRVVPSLDRLCEEDGTVWIDWAVPFWRAVRDGKVTPDLFERAARHYAWSYGLPDHGLYWTMFTVGLVDVDGNPINPNHEGESI